LERQTVDVSAGYTDCAVTTVVADNDLTHLAVFCSWRGEPLSVLEPLARAVMGPAFTIEPRNEYVAATVEYEVPPAWRQARQRIDAKLGNLSDVNVPLGLAKHYAELTSPLESLTVGESCGYAGGPPKGRRAMLALVAAKRPDLLRNAVRGPNPEGRVYGVLGLDELGVPEGKLDEVEVLDGLPIEVETCVGCIVRGKPSNEVFGDLAQFHQLTM
jgi:hypothetical protein